MRLIILFKISIIIKLTVYRMYTIVLYYSLFDSFRLLMMLLYVQFVCIIINMHSLYTPFVQQTEN